MSMFCYQCQEAAGGKGCSVVGVCGKKEDVAAMQDLLVYVIKGIAYIKEKFNVDTDKNSDRFLTEGLFSTITNANFDVESIRKRVKEGVKIKAELLAKIDATNLPENCTWTYNSDADIDKKSFEVGVLTEKNEDVRSLKELLMYGVKGLCAYFEHAMNLGYGSDDIHKFVRKALTATIDSGSTADGLTGLVIECGKFGVDAMALLDKANTESYGNPEITEVNIGVSDKPGILISGHDLKDMEILLEQTAGTGIDVYTHCEMLPANYYPAFKKYDHFVGNYGSSWWNQDKEFESFNGPILMTTNCITTPKDSYKDKIFTTGSAGFVGVKHIEEKADGSKDFSEIIELAKKCKAPTEIEKGKIVGGFAHAQVLALADKVVDAVKSGAIKKFVVMAGCDGRSKKREYYTEFAEELPKDTVILTAGCAKYRYNKLDLGDIGGIPRVLDAGQCNDSYSLAVIALKLKEVFGLEDVNELPIAYNIAWYEQKAVIVLLALLYLGVKNIHLGPTLPAFLSPNVAEKLIELFKLSGISNVKDDMAKLVG